MTLAFQRALSVPWAITEQMLQTILLVANREGEGAEAVSVKRGRKLDNTRSVELRGGVAIIPVFGPIIPRADSFDEVSGLTGVNRLALDIEEALSNPAVDALILNFDSPGGALPGVNELAKIVEAGRKRKPMKAYVFAEAASAAYWLAAATSEIVVDDAALVGSIGVRMAVRKPESPDSARCLEFISSQSPKKKMDVSTEAGRSQAQALVDEWGALFVQSIVRLRGLTEEQVLALAGDVLIGSTAVELGFADRVGSLEGLIAELQQQAHSGFFGAGAQKDNAMKFAETALGKRLAALLNSDSEAEVNANATSVQTPALPAGAQAELAALRAAHAVEQRSRLEAEAQSFVDGLFAANKLLPFALNDAKADYLRAALDDAAHPVAAGEPARVDLLRKRYDAIPAHALTAERVADTKEGAKVLASAAVDTITERDAKHAAEARAWAARMNRSAQKGAGK